MVVTIEVLEQLAEQARKRGVSVEAYVQEILERQTTTATKIKPALTPEQARAWLDSLAQFSDKIPPLPDEITRDWIYQDHD